MKTKILKRVVTVCLLFSITKINAQEVWQPVGSGLGKGVTESVNALLNDTVNNILYAFGSFRVMNDSIKVNGEAFWDGAKWSSHSYTPPGGIPIGAGTAMAMYDGKIIFAGDYGNVGSFDGTSGQLLGTFNDAVTCLASYKGKLYAGGDFSKVNGVAAYKLACWDGSKWSAVGGAIGGFAPPVVWALGVWNDKLYVGGFFNKVGGLPVGNIASWDGEKWDSLGSGTFMDNGGGLNTGYVYSMGVYKNDLIVGGWFDSAGGRAAHNIARWDGNSWSAMNDGFNGGVRAIISCKNKLYVGGEFDFTAHPSHLNIERIAVWNGTQWESIDNGVENIVYCMAVYDSTLYIGGYLNQAGGNTVSGIARLVNVTGITDRKKTEPLMQVYPNPVSSQFTVHSSQFTEKIEITNLLGQTIINMQLSQPQKETEVDVSSLPEGIYLLRVRTKKDVTTGKFVKQ